MYVLRNGIDNNAFCDPLSGTCLTGPGSTISGNTFTLSNLAAGQYTLWLANAGGTLGICSQTYNIEIPEIPVLALTGMSSVANASCYNAVDGSVVVSSSGGKSPITYKLTNGSLIYTRTVATAGTPVTFTGLVAGAYTASVTDACGQVPATQSFTIRQPAKLTLSLTPIAALCNSPGDGKVQANLSVSSGVFDIPLSGSFDYEVRNAGTTVQGKYGSTTTGYTFTDLPVGTYSLRVKDNALGSWCSGDEKPFSIAAPAPIPTPTLVAQNVACAGSNEGSLTINGTGGNGLYQYTLRRSATGQVAAQTTNTILSGLTAGTYQLVISRIHPSCADSYTYPSLITIAEPTALTLSYTKTDITCQGAGDGKITAAISGGTPPYSLFYKKNTETNWTSFTGLSLTSLDPEVYRLRVVDGNNCEALSPVVTIIEPALLQLTSVIRKDIQCLGGSGSIDMTATGGTLPYSFEYSLNGGTYTAFTKTTLLNPGAYQVHVRDANGCSATYGSSLTISAPATTLDFTYTLSDYNGFAISCFGGSNGKITLTASGGNGGSYSGYQYAMDGGAYQSNPVIEGIAAGLHSFAIKDARGCVVTKSISFTQSSAQLAIQLQNKVNVVCAGDRTGSIQVSAAGGVGPYQFSLNGSEYSANNIFTGLTAGNYQLSVQDRNGCAASFTQTITSLYAPIQIVAQTSAISCRGGSDGSIQLAVSGGQAPYSYQWSGQNNATATLSNLTAGGYTVRITDNAGCSKDTTLILTEPDRPVSLTVQTTPVCYGKTNGLIRVRASGGTPPYQYSVDNGQSFQQSADFATVGVGSYAVLIKDSQNCTATAAAQIDQRNDQPSPDFIVATRQNALDTMIIRDISWPKPDSVHWQFDPLTQILDTTVFSATIRFTQAGTYILGMTGYFGGCEYTTSRSLTIAPYDPDAGPVVLPGYAIIKKFEVSPNPNTGQFEITAELIRKQQLTVIVLDVLGNEKYRKKWDQALGVSEAVTLSNIASGLYVVRLITENDAREVRLVITP